MTETFRKLSDAHRRQLDLEHTVVDERTYDRVWSAIMRLIKLLDEFPGRRDKILSQAEFAVVIAERDSEDCLMRRERMFTLANSLIEGSRQLLPRTLRDASEGNVAIDATFVPLYGKTGNPSPTNPHGKRWSANHDGGWYRREGSHGAVTHADADMMNKIEGSKAYSGTAPGKRMWGVEIEIARATANYAGFPDQFPLLTHAVSFHIPGAIVGEGARLVESLHERGHPINLVIVDRAYSNGLYGQYAVPVRLLGGKNVFTYRDSDLGEQAFDVRGFVQISGSWYLDTLPKVLREADRVILAARNSYKRSKPTGSRKAPETSEQVKKRKQAHADWLLAATLYKTQFAQRAKSLLRPKGRMDADWTRRYLVPIDSPDYAKWKAQPAAHQSVTVMMKRPEGKEAELANAGGLKHEQHFCFGGEEWTRANGMRNGVESVNRSLKRSQYEDIADPDKRAIRGNTFTYLVVAVATVVENLRQIINFYKRHLAVKTVTPKNNRLPSVFWQDPDRTPGQDLAGLPPDIPPL
ncbi:MAG: hypothetical protein H7248_00025 [Microbacteriaceae bacterium]|nr:hypothetical protein [Microbacteriaceae bacterium]